MTTLSEGAPTPPPRSYHGVNGVMEPEGIETILADHYDSALKFEETLSSTMVFIENF